MDTLWLLIPAVALGVMALRFRWVSILSVIIALVAVLFFQPITDFIKNVTSGTSSSSDTSVIERFDAQFDLDASGLLTVTETLDVRFTEVRRGIYRFFDPNGPRGSDATHPITIQSIERCDITTGSCAPEPYTTYDEDGYLVARIGVESVTYLPGTVNRYRLQYTQSQTLTRSSSTGDVQWYWNVVGSGWAMRMEQVSLSATLPAAPAGPVQCAVGQTEEGVTNCTVEVENARLSQTIAGLPRQTPVTWRVVFDDPALAAVGINDGGTRFWFSLGFFLALIVGLAGFAGLMLGIRAHRERPAMSGPVFAEPGIDLLPLTWTYQEEPPKEAFSAMLLHLKRLGVLDVTADPSTMYQSKPEWIEVRRTDVQLLDGVAGAQELLTALSLTTPGSVQRIDQDSVAMGKKVKSVQGTLRGLATSQAIAQGLATRSPSGILIHALAVLAAPAALAIIALLGAPAPALALAVAGVAGPFSDRSLTTSLSAFGRHQRDQVSGLRTALSTKASMERFDYSVKVRYFSQYLAWAVALDCADKWAEVCRPPAGMPETPEYRMAMNTYYTAHAIQHSVTAVSAAAVASYAATQSSSGSGGGGFSGGGGGGGGGGGSW